MEATLKKVRKRSSLLSRMSASVKAPSRQRRPLHWLDVIADPIRLQILRSLSEVSDASTSELAARSPASYQTLRRHLEALEAFGVIETRPGVSDGEKSGRPAARFSLTAGVRESLRSALADRASAASTSSARRANPSRRG
jgi:predicted ArsR family transcriptional regulator